MKTHIPARLLARLERAYGSDLSDIRLRFGPEARCLGARAFAWGPQIFCDPAEAHNLPTVLAHEVVHVLQQRAGRTRREPDRALEREAVELAARAADPAARDLLAVSLAPQRAYARRVQRIWADYSTLSGNGMVNAPYVARTILTKGNMSGGSGPNGAICPPGWLTGECPAHHQRGHLIGNKLGGSGNDPQNLVTLTAGSNHPIMYEYEDAIHNYVSTHNCACYYAVMAHYNPSKYLPVSYQDPVTGLKVVKRGASNNPFCEYPAPESLVMVLIDVTDPTQGANPLANKIPPESLTTIFVSVHTKFLTDRGVAVPQPAPSAFSYVVPALILPNGVYKLYKGAKHTINGCWAATHGTVIDTF
jgi:hypothetical protein